MVTLFISRYILSILFSYLLYVFIISSIELIYVIWCNLLNYWIYSSNSLLNSSLYNFYNLNFYCLELRASVNKVGIDSIELSMQVIFLLMIIIINKKNNNLIIKKIEEDLGYVISAETLPVLNKVKHYVNYVN